MKKILAVMACLVLISAGAEAVEISLGFQAGLRTASGTFIKDVYGNGICYFPYATVNFGKGFTVGAGYEFGYSRSGKIGLYEEDTTLKVSGIEAFVGYQFSISIVTPYVFVGFGSFSYKQTVDSLAAQPVDFKKSTFFAAAGLKVSPIKYIYISAEAKYVPLMVKPYEDEVDLGGLRLTAGIGLSFGF
jgi:hypothetical protein